MKNDVTPYLAYFEQENAARPNLSVFLTTMSGEGFSQCEKSISEVVREGERIADSAAQDGGASRSIYEAAPSEGKADGWLPVLTFDQEPDSFMGVRSLVLLRQGKADGMLRDAQMQLALLLAGKTDRLAITDTIDGHDAVSYTHLQVIDAVGIGIGGKPVQIDGDGSHGLALEKEFQQMFVALEPGDQFLYLDGSLFKLASLGTGAGGIQPFQCLVGGPMHQEMPADSQKGHSGQDGPGDAHTAFHVASFLISEVSCTSLHISKNTSSRRQPSWAHCAAAQSRVTPHRRKFSST